MDVTTYAVVGKPVTREDGSFCTTPLMRRTA